MSTLPTSGGVPACPQHPTAPSLRHEISTTRPVHPRVRAAGVIAVAALILSACDVQGEHSGSHGSTPTASSSAAVGPEDATSANPTSANAAGRATVGAHNDADISFAQGMVVHHRGAVEMSALAADRAGSDAVRQLADRIEAAQTPEIDLMTGWLQTWSSPVASAGGTASTNPEMSGHDMSGDLSTDHQAMGMMSAQDMASLESASGADFDRLFLRLMVVHHEGAVTMSQAELADGQSADARALARTIIAGQTAEIAEMRGLLAAK